ncbi:MAG: hypothetical protein BM556_09010 [Bacteriovorax sp. MedPE-SWde]|nr:MAG: hypothetical protein BM556_09010 [Bacteriovorax sp. MedPE-SWde]
MFKYIRFFDYYLSIIAKRLGGKSVIEPEKNGEYTVLENIVKLKKDQSSFYFVDGGANVGNHIKRFDSSCKKFNVKNPSIFAVEPFPDTISVLTKNLEQMKYKLIKAALGEIDGQTSFYSEPESKTSGQNSTINHYYLSKKIDVDAITLDTLVSQEGIDHIDFLKLDIEGAEYRALSGARSTLEKGKIDYIQLEYNQTWIEGGGTIAKILDLCNQYGYSLYRIRSSDLLSIPSYHFTLDDFVFCNYLLIKNGCKLPLPCHRKASPILS